jgi:hypothetical protein
MTARTLALSVALEERFLRRPHCRLDRRMATGGGRRARGWRWIRETGVAGLHHLGRDEVEGDAHLGHRRRARKGTAFAFESRAAEHEVPAGADRATRRTHREGLVGSGGHEESDVDPLLEQ